LITNALIGALSQVDRFRGRELSSMKWLIVIKYVNCLLVWLIILMRFTYRSCK